MATVPARPIFGEKDEGPKSVGGHTSNVGTSEVKMGGEYHWKEGRLTGNYRGVNPRGGQRAITRGFEGGVAVGGDTKVPSRRFLVQKNDTHGAPACKKKKQNPQ